MNQVVIQEATADTLLLLVDRAARALAGARSYAEVLEAKSLAASAADAASRAARLAKSIDAHSHVVGAAHRMKADALAIEHRAQQRIADEYDAAQERGEVRGQGNIPSENVSTIADVGLTSKQIFEARQIRDAELRDPGIVERTLNDAIARGDEPTRAEVKRAISPIDALRQKGEQEERAWLDNRDFRALRKLWRASSPGAQLMFRDYIKGEA
jgi:hypothetical protein